MDGHGRWAWPRRIAIALTGVAVLSVLCVVALTWHSFPGALVKNRLRLGGDPMVGAKERGELLVAEHDGHRPGRVEVRVEKAARRLTLSCDGEVWHTCSVALGSRPEGHKEVEGDNRTPEGTYAVCTRNERSKFHLFLGLSYPGETDAERGLADGLLTPSQHDAIVAAVRSGRRPPWDTPLGGAVGIHGSGSWTDWTRGCVAVDDDDIEVLWFFCAIGTPVVIRP